MDRQSLKSAIRLSHIPWFSGETPFNRGVISPDGDDLHVIKKGD
jgi:hypothetical protein